MTLPPLPLIGGALLIDNSGFMEHVNTCSRKQEYNFIRKRIHSGEKPALEFGSLTHATKELRYCRYGSNPVDDEYYNDISTLLTEFYQDHDFPAGDWRNLNFAMDMVKYYDTKYSHEDFSLLEYSPFIDCPVCDGKGEIEAKKSDNGDLIRPSRPCVYCKGTKKRNVMVEMSFTLPLYTHRHLESDDTGLIANEIPVIYTGKIDLPISYASSGIWINDHKTTGTGGQPFWDEQRMSAQHRGYCWAFQELTKLPVLGYQVNMIRTKEVPQYAKNNKTFTVAHGYNKGKKLTAESFWNETFQREKFLLKPGELDEWKNNTIDLVEEFFWHYSRGYFPMKTKWCSIYGRCPYYDVCTLAPEDRLAQLYSGMFANNDWSPLKK